MNRIKSESDEDAYVPSGLLTSSPQLLQNRDIKMGGICEFYNSNQPGSSISEKPFEESEVIADLSPEQQTPSTSVRPTTPLPPHFTMKPNIIISRAPPLPYRGPARGSTIVQRALHSPTTIPTSFIPPSTLPYPPLIRVPMRSMIYPQRHFPYAHPGFHMKMYHPPPTHRSQIPPQQYFAAMNPAVPVPPGMVYVSRIPPGHPHSKHLLSQSQQPMHEIKLLPKPNQQAITNAESRKQDHLEAVEKRKLEREARKALMKEKRAAEMISKSKMKNESTEDERIRERMTRFFSKDMFAIRLRDVGSVDRNNEIWRVDNHILIQKFCVIPSALPYPKQFQSTNKLAGYDSRAIWRFFLLDPANVEIDKYGSKVTVYNFPPVEVLEQAKRDAEEKDEEFKKVEATELEEKINKFEAKQISRSEERVKKRATRKQKRLEKKESEKIRRYIAESKLYTEQKDDEICRSVIDGILDALDEEECDDEVSLSSSSEMSYSDDDDDAGSLITLLNSSDSEDEDPDLQFDDHDIRFELYGEDEVPRVGLELTVD